MNTLSPPPFIVIHTVKYKFRLRFPNASNQAASWTQIFRAGLMLFCSTEIHTLSPINSHAAAYNVGRKSTTRDTYRPSPFPRATPATLRALALPLALLALPPATQTPRTSPPIPICRTCCLQAGRKRMAVRCPPSCLYQITVYVKV